MNDIVKKEEEDAVQVVDEKKRKRNPFLKLLATGSCNTCPLGKDIYGEGYPCKYYSKDAVCYIDSQVKKLVKTDKTDKEGLRQSAFEVLSLNKERYISAMLKDKVEGKYNPHVERIGKVFSGMVENIRQIDKPLKFMMPNKMSFQQVNVKQEGYSPEFIKEVFRLLKKKHEGEKETVVTVDAEIKE